MNFFVRHFFIFSLFQYFSWYVSPLFSLFSFISLIILIEKDEKIYKKLFIIFFFFLSQNFIITYWLITIYVTKGLLSIFCNSLLLTLLCGVYLTFAQKLKSTKEIAFFISIWISFEYFHHIWAFSWPWLTLGNVFGEKPELVQWYKFTGVLGGSLWVLVSNIIVLNSIRRFKIDKKSVLPAICITLIPITISYILLNITDKKKIENKLNIAVVHTKFDNNDKISDISKVDSSITLLSKTILNKHTIILYPELFLRGQWLNGFENSQIKFLFRRFLYKNPNVSIVIGGEFYIEQENGINSTSNNLNSLIQYKKYNAALKIDSSELIDFKTKKIFIPIVEYVPDIFKQLSLKSDNYSLMSQNINSFKIINNKAFIPICYEAVNSVFMVNNWKDENFILMIASESFFNDSKIGMKQYLNISRLRAIETGKYIFKASNSGYSAVINNKGQSEKTFYLQKGKMKIIDLNGYSNNKKTFFIKSKGLFNKLILILMIILFTSLLLKKFKLTW